MENYIVINGQKMELTKEQMEKLGIQEEKDNPFKRKNGEKFYFINVNGMVNDATDYESFANEYAHRVGNYCRDESLMRQRALHETLDRLLWRFACENGELENSWDGEHRHYSIYNVEGAFNLVYNKTTKYLQPTFPSEEAACLAIHDIIEPFILENPDFVW